MGAESDIDNFFHRSRVVSDDLILLINEILRLKRIHQVLAGIVGYTKQTLCWNVRLRQHCKAAFPD